ncbi:MAG: ATP-grasp domain-containing protein [Pirellulaceae bacterium]
MSKSPLRMAVLAAPNSWYLRDLQRAAGSRDQVFGCTFSQITARLGEVAGPRLAAADCDLTAADALLVRSMPPGTLEQVVFRMDALARVAEQGTLVLNPPRALEIAIDKYLTLARLVDAGLRVPPTVTCQTEDAAMAAFEELGGDVVVKPLFGSEGRGIMRISDPALALRAFKLLEQLGAVIYVQSYIPHFGYDIRVLVIGDQLLAMRRSNPTDWRTNVSRGATTQAAVIDATQQELALTAAQAVGAPLAGVDLLPARDGHLYVLEVNAVPGWKALARTLQCDVARLVLDYVAESLVSPIDA